MGRYRSRSRSYSPRRSKRYDRPRESRSRRERRSPPPSGLLVRNISLDARPEDLRVRFEKFGPIKDVYLPKNYYTGEPRGFGFVKFRHPEDAAEAKDHLNETVIGGREIRIVYAEDNRKNPHEMRRVSHTSDRGSYRRRSPVRSSQRRYRSPSRSPSPARGYSRDQMARGDRYSPRRSRSFSRSISPHDEREYKSPQRFRSISRSPPRDKKKYRSGHKSPRPGRDDRVRDEVYNEHNRSPSASGKGHTLSRSHRSPSPRGNSQRSLDERSLSTRRNVLSPLRSPSPCGNGRRPHDERYGELDKSPSWKGKVHSPARSRSQSYSSR